jgi:Domain of unknown function (DUF4173)
MNDAKPPIASRRDIFNAPVPSPPDAVIDVGRLLRHLPGPTADAPARVALVVLVVAVAGDVLLRQGPATIAIGLLAVVLVAGLWWAELLATRVSAGLGAAGVVFAMFAGMRASPWLVGLDLVAAAGLIAVACSVAQGGRLDDLGAAAVVQRVTRLTVSAVRGPAWVLRPRVRGVRKRRVSQIGGVVRGLLLAAPLVLVLGVLLTSADAVFAQLLTPDLHLGRVAGHVVLILVCGVGAAALCTDAASPAVARWRPQRRPLGAMEGATILASLVLLFAVFSASQLIALTPAAERVLATAGLTRAEYARSGFFQLLWVAAITLGVLGALRAVTQVTSDRQRRVLRWLTQAAIVLTLAIVAVAVRRLALYTSVFGLTMLRLYSTLFAVWIGVVFLALAAAVHGVHADRTWVMPFAATAGLVLLAVLNVVNVEAQVARYNLADGGPTGQPDLTYLVRDLSADAVPTLLAHAGDRRAGLTTLLCASHGQPDVAASPLAYNWSRSRAATLLAGTCTPL